MIYIVTVKKKSPIHTLWRKQNLHKARLQEVLFTYNKQEGQYSAQGQFGNIGALMKNPSLIVALTTESVGEVTSIAPPEPVFEELSKPLKKRKFTFKDPEE